MKNILDEKKFSRENGERKDIYGGGKRSDSFYFCEKKIFRDRIRYLSNACMRNEDVPGKRIFGYERVPLFFLPDFPSDGRDSTGMVERKEWKREKVDRKELSSCFEIGIFPLETGEGERLDTGDL